MEKQEADVRETMTKLKQAEYRLNPKKRKFFLKKTIERVRHKKATEEYDHYETNWKQLQN